MDADQLAETTRLVSQIGQLRDGIVLAIVFLAVVGAVTFILWMWISYKKHSSAELTKNARAKQDADSAREQTIALKKLTDSVNVFSNGQANYIKKIDTTTTSLSSSMRDLQGTISQVDVLVKRILEKQDGVVSLPTSVMIIQTYFFKVLFNDAVLIVNKSLQENDYKNRSAFIINKVKTDIGKVMTAIKDELSDLDLAIHPSLFFKLESSSGERYILVDLIWESVNELFLSEQDLRQKWEEASYKIMNTIKDHFAEIKHETIEGPTRYDRSKFKTPTGLKALKE